ncbi:hypothetical protein SAY86_025961 [Trapa natans]|uniref:Transcription factor IIIC 90kDa subunit N-terminal domain-containing protein n=1 Tax=Trapa natans TaxID=22666 RepID=A0AAN7KIY5_TRANT|nr:hypothetical protein SAY86_025961 [Trapa natans]
MCSRFQAATLVASPSYPNSIAWSEENLIAVANGQLVTILSPESPSGPRGLVKIPTSKPFPIGVIKSEDAVSGCLLPTCLSRERESIRSISWSPLGMSANSGCLLAICTVEGHVKLYRPPFCDYSAEWIEVMDISEDLYYHLKKVNFKKRGIHSLNNSRFTEEHQNMGKPPNLCPRGERKQKRLNVSSTLVCCNTKNSGSGAEPSSSRLGSSDAETSSHGSPEVLLIEFCDGNDKLSPDLSHSRTKSQRKEIGSCGLPVITADEYVYRSALLSALVIAWSPLLQSSSESCSGYERPPSYSVLAVGGKSGTISFWRIDMPKVYSIEHANVHPSVAFIWSLQAHNSWVTTISWLLLTSDSSSTSICLASGSSDGSVRIWLGSTEDFSRPTEGTCCPFILLKEIIIADPATAPVSVVSLTLTSESQEKMFIAIGKGSGSFEVWMDYKLSGEFQKISSVNAHDHVITGLTWAYNGNSLFSSSQDNFVRRWSVNENCISEIPISSNTPGPRALGDLPSAFYSCHGVAVSPGNLVLVMVRSFDSDLLNPMYQSRSLKAAVEFFWIGGQEHCISSDASLKSKTECVPHFREEDIICWKANMLWSLKQLESPSKWLVVWDVIAALLVFKRTAPKIAEQFVVEWLSKAYLGLHADLQIKDILSHMSRSFSKFTSRQLQLLNVICRRVALSEVKPEQISHGVVKQGMLDGSANEEVGSWVGLVLGSEMELRKRLVDCSLSACSRTRSHPEESKRQNELWSPSVCRQMKQWVACKASEEKQQKDLSTGTRTYKRRLKTDKDVEEKCSFCSASVPFESPEVAFCKGQDITNTEGQTHRLARCAVSMQICSPTTPSWFCMCCHRRAARLLPEPFFRMIGEPTSSRSTDKFHPCQVQAKPLCPFCGILMQRLQPDFLLSAAPV